MNYTDDHYQTSDIYESDESSDYSFSSSSEEDDDTDVDADDDGDDGSVPHMYTLCYSDSANDNNHWGQNGGWDSDSDGTWSDDSYDGDDEGEDDEDDGFQTIPRQAKD